MYAIAEPWAHEAPHSSRDDHWLRCKLEDIWENHFRDVPRVNTIRASFSSRHWKARLGLITLSHDAATTYIAINGILREREVPEFVNVATMAHELVHYTHGFGSPLPRRHAHPHRGGVVQKELTARGLGKEQRAHQQWVHEHWQELCARRFPLRSVR